MSANAATLSWIRPRTLTDREITTVHAGSSSAGFGPRETVRPHSVSVAVQTTPIPEWLTQTAEAGARLLLLPFDWNREGAPTIETAAIQAALGALLLFMSENCALPQWTPTDEGGIQLDWHQGGIDLEIEFGPSKPEGYAVFVDNLERYSNWDGDVPQNIENLRRIVCNVLA